MAQSWSDADEEDAGTHPSGLSNEWLRPPTPTLMLFLFSALTPGICKQITQSDDWHDLQLFYETTNLYGVVKMAGR